ncbi:MAG: periplasmic protein TonB [Acidobacteriota bacterium]|jgi:TonB family protein|nr:periplasmic protein TonB [Acidobacteriota bacterium]
MKSCPTCHRVYEDETIHFCLEDGAPLVTTSASSSDPGATLVIPAARVTDQAATEVLTEKTIPATQPALAAPRQPDAPMHAVPSERKRNALPWILGAAVVLGLSAIAVAWIVTSRSEPQSSHVAQKTSQSENTNTARASESNGDNLNLDNLSEVPEIQESPESDLPREEKPSRSSEQSSSTVRTIPTVRETPPVIVVEPTPPPPKPTPAQVPKTPIAGGVMNGKAISLPKPAYPPIAKAAHASGTVTVQVTINESGKVISAHAVSGHPLLQQSAVQAAYQARFTPTQLSGQPVKVTGVISYNFVAQ